MFTKRKSILVKFNTSENPFAYIRSEKDINNFVENIKKAGKAIDCKTDVSQNALKLLEILSLYLFDACIEIDWSIESLIKLLNDTCLKTSTKDEKNTFELMVDIQDNEDIKTKYKFFKKEIVGTYSDLYQETVQECLYLLSSIPAKQLVEGLKNNKCPKQAVLWEEKKKLEIWFNYTNTFKLCKYIKINEHSTFAVVDISRKKNELKKGYLLFLIKTLFVRPMNYIEAWHHYRIALEIYNVLPRWKKRRRSAPVPPKE